MKPTLWSRKSYIPSKILDRKKKDYDYAFSVSLGTHNEYHITCSSSTRYIVSDQDHCVRSYTVTSLRKTGMLKKYLLLQLMVQSRYNFSAFFLCLCCLYFLLFVQLPLEPSCLPHFNRCYSQTISTSIERKWLLFCD